jgi:SAM-dependent methyltransferase
MGETQGDAWRIEDDLAEEGEPPVGGEGAEGEAPPPSPPPVAVSEAGPPAGDAAPALVMPCRCPVCDRPGVETGGPFARCGGCGTLFRKERPSLGQVAKARDARFSRAFALPNHEERREARALAGEAMRGFFRLRTGKPVALNAFGKSVLEVNCGLGMRLRAFQDYGWAPAGTETSATAYEYARRQALDVRHGWLDEASFGRTRFDLALFCGSFGELPAPSEAVGKLHDLMAPDGLVCVLREPLAVEGASPPADESRLVLYTPDALRQVLCAGKFSFESEEVEGGAGTFWFKAKRGR